MWVQCLLSSSISRFLYTLLGELLQNQLTNASALLLPGETLKTTTYRRNLSIIGSNNTYFFIEIGEKDTRVSLFYLMNPASSNSRENSGILV